MIENLKEIPRLILADTNLGVVNAWRAAFEDLSEITVHRGSILDLPESVAATYAIVSPANSFGFMDGGLDMAISKRLGWHVQERLQLSLRTNYYGELLVGQAEMVATDNKRIPYVIAAPTMRVPMILEETPNPYLAMRGLLILLKERRIDDDPLRCHIPAVAIPGMGTGVGRVNPAVCAQQMRAALDAIVLKTRPAPVSWDDAQKQHQLLYGDRVRDLQLRS